MAIGSGKVRLDVVPFGVREICRVRLSHTCYSSEIPSEDHFSYSLTETVWKIRIGSKLEPDESVKRSEEAQSLPRCAAKDAPSRPLQPISKQFQKVSSRKPPIAPVLEVYPSRPRPSGFSLHRTGTMAML